MKNLFVVNTPYHLMTCFILTHSIYKSDENYLVLMHPHGYDKWQTNKIMKYNIISQFITTADTPTRKSMTIPPSITPAMQESLSMHLPIPLISVPLRRLT